MALLNTGLLLALFSVFYTESLKAQPININSTFLETIYTSPETLKNPAAKKIDFGIGFGFSSHLKDNSSTTEFSKNTLYYYAQSSSVGYNFSGNLSLFATSRYFLTPTFAVGLIYTYQSLDETKSIFPLEKLSPSGELELTGKGFFINFFPGILFINGSRTNIKAGLIYKSYSGSGTFPDKSVVYDGNLVNSYSYTLKPGFAPFISGGLEFTLSQNIFFNLEVFGEFASTSIKRLKIDEFKVYSFGSSLIADNQIGLRFSISGGFDI